MDKLLSSGPSEGKVQRYLEANSAWIPLPFLLGHHVQHNAIIAQFELDRDRIADFAYVTKNTVRWCVVFLEIETPDKRLFTQSNRADFHSQTRQAIAQIEDWKTCVTDNCDRILERLRPLMTISPRLSRNPVSFSYGLIIGRNAKGTFDARQAARIARLETESGIVLQTYDSLLRSQTLRPSRPRVLLRHKAAGYFIEHPADTSLFACVHPEHLALSTAASEWYERQGYDLTAWRKGELLVVNQKLPNQDTGKAFRQAMKRSRTE